MTRHTLFAVTLYATEVGTGRQVRDTITHLAGIPDDAIGDVLDLAAENVARRITGAAPTDDVSPMVLGAIRVRLAAHAEDTVICGPVLVSAAARHVADLLIDQYRSDLATDARAAA